MMSTATAKEHMNVFVGGSFDEQKHQFTAGRLIDIGSGVSKRRGKG